MEQPEIKNGNPIWLLGALPVFFLVWWIVGIGYAFIAGPGALAVLYVLCVWLPNDEARKLTRKAMFVKARALLRDYIPSQLRKIADREVVSECEKALLMIKALIDNFEQKSTVQGKIELKILPTLQNMSGLLTRWHSHEIGELPLPKDQLVKVRNDLLHFDDLIKSYQAGGIDQSGYLTQLYETETDMQSAGIDPEEGGK